MRRGEGKARYFPLDNALSQMTTRVLRAVQHYDHISTEDLAERLCIGPENPERGTLRFIVMQMCTRGELECIERSYRHPKTRRWSTEQVYRLSAKGRCQLHELFAAYQRGVESAA